MPMAVGRFFSSARIPLMPRHRYSGRIMPKTGAQRRQERIVAGLPPYTPTEAATRRARDVARNRQRQRDYLARMADYKVARGCADCGYAEHPAALHFDHLPGFVKIGGISRMWHRSPAVVEAEIAKCEVVCANCHAVRTARRREQAKN